MINNLKATKRETKTKGQINTLRSKGFIPAILYGGKSPNLKLSISEKFVDDVLRAENFLSTVIVSPALSVALKLISSNTFSIIV